MDDFVSFGKIAPIGAFCSGRDNHCGDMIETLSQVGGHKSPEVTKLKPQQGSQKTSTTLANCPNHDNNHNNNNNDDDDADEGNQNQVAQQLVAPAPRAAYNLKSSNGSSVDKRCLDDFTSNKTPLEASLRLIEAKHKRPMQSLRQINIVGQLNHSASRGILFVVVSQILAIVLIIASIGFDFNSIANFNGWQQRPLILGAEAALLWPFNSASNGANQNGGQLQTNHQVQPSAGKSIWPALNLRSGAGDLQKSRRVTRNSATNFGATSKNSSSPADAAAASGDIQSSPQQPISRQYHYFWNHDQIEPKTMASEAQKILADAQLQTDQQVVAAAAAAATASTNKEAAVESLMAARSFEASPNASQPLVDLAEARPSGNEAATSRQDTLVTAASSPELANLIPFMPQGLPGQLSGSQLAPNVQQQLTSMVLQMQRQQQMSMLMQPRFEAARRVAAATSAAIAAAEAIKQATGHQTAVHSPTNPMSRLWATAESSHLPVAIAPPPSLAAQYGANSPFAMAASVSMPQVTAPALTGSGVPVYGPFVVAPSIAQQALQQALHPPQMTRLSAMPMAHHHNQVQSKPTSSSNNQKTSSRFAASLLGRRRSWPFFGGLTSMANFNGHQSATGHHQDKMQPSSSQMRPTIMSPPTSSSKTSFNAPQQQQQQQQQLGLELAPETVALLDLASKQLANAIAGHIQVGAARQKLAAVLAHGLSGGQELLSNPGASNFAADMQSSASIQSINHSTKPEQSFNYRSIGHLQPPYLIPASVLTPAHLAMNLVSHSPFVSQLEQNHQQLLSSQPSQQFDSPMMMSIGNSSAIPFGSRLKRRHLSSNGSNGHNLIRNSPIVFKATVARPPYSLTAANNGANVNYDQINEIGESKRMTSNKKLTQNNQSTRTTSATPTFEPLIEEIYGSVASSSSPNQMRATSGSNDNDKSATFITYDDFGPRQVNGPFPGHFAETKPKKLVNSNSHRQQQQQQVNTRQPDEPRRVVKKDDPMKAVDGASSFITASKISKGQTINLPQSSTLNGEPQTTNDDARNNLRHLFLAMASTEGPIYNMQQNGDSPASSVGDFYEVDESQHEAQTQLRRLKRSTSSWRSIDSISGDFVAPVDSSRQIIPLKSPVTAKPVIQASAWLASGSSGSNWTSKSSPVLKRQAEMTSNANAQNSRPTEEHSGNQGDEVFKVKRVTASASVIHSPSSKLKQTISTSRAQVFAGTALPLRSFAPSPSTTSQTTTTTSTTAPTVTQSSTTRSTLASESINSIDSQVDPMSASLSESARVVNYFQNVDNEPTSTTSRPQQMQSQQSSIVQHQQVAQPQQQQPVIVQQQPSNSQQQSVPQLNVGFPAPSRANRNNQQAIAEQIVDNQEDIRRKNGQGNGRSQVQSTGPSNHQDFGAGQQQSSGGSRVAINAASYGSAPKLLASSNSNNNQQLRTSQPEGQAHQQQQVSLAAAAPSADISSAATGTQAYINNLATGGPLASHSNQQLNNQQIRHHQQPQPQQQQQQAMPQVSSSDELNTNQDSGVYKNAIANFYSRQTANQPSGGNMNQQPLISNSPHGASNNLNFQRALISSIIELNQAKRRNSNMQQAIAMAPNFETNNNNNTSNGNQRSMVNGVNGATDRQVAGDQSNSFTEEILPNGQVDANFNAMPKQQQFAPELSQERPSSEELSSNQAAANSLTQQQQQQVQQSQEVDGFGSRNLLSSANLEPANLGQSQNMMAQDQPIDLDRIYQQQQALSSQIPASLTSDNSANLPSAESSAAMQALNSFAANSQPGDLSLFSRNQQVNSGAFNHHQQQQQPQQLQPSASSDAAAQLASASLQPPIMGTVQQQQQIYSQQLQALSAAVNGINQQALDQQQQQQFQSPLEDSLINQRLFHHQHQQQPIGATSNLQRNFYALPASLGAGQSYSSLNGALDHEDVTSSSGVASGLPPISSMAQLLALQSQGHNIGDFTANLLMANSREAEKREQDDSAEEPSKKKTKSGNKSKGKKSAGFKQVSHHYHFNGLMSPFEDGALDQSMGAPFNPLEIAGGLQEAELKAARQRVKANKQKAQEEEEEKQKQKQLAEEEEQKPKKKGFLRRFSIKNLFKRFKKDKSKQQQQQQQSENENGNDESSNNEKGNSSYGNDSESSGERR